MNLDLPLTHRDCPSKLPWNTRDSQEDEFDAPGDEGHLKLKTVIMSEVQVNTNAHLQAQFDEANKMWSDAEVRTMIYVAQERGLEWWIQEYVVRRAILPQKLLLAFGLIFSNEMPQPDNEKCLKILKMTLLRVRRERLTRYNTIKDVANLLKKSKRIMVLSGAGISVSSGIPDFRSKDGLYQMIDSVHGLELDDPQQIFDLEYFKKNPQVFYSFAKEIYPSTHEPSLSHYFIKRLEEKKKLLRNYTQNIDGLENSAGIKNVLQCHGSFSEATCLKCETQFPTKMIEDHVLAQRVPLCLVCPPPIPKKRKKRKKPLGRWSDDDESSSDEEDSPKSILKPNITFFGEKLTDKFDKLLRLDRESVDLLIVMGTSLNVTPVSEMLSHIPHSVPQILINRTPIKHMNADVVLLGNADSVVRYLCSEALGPSWDLPSLGHSIEGPASKKRSSSQSFEMRQGTPVRVGDSHVWLFEGAEGGKFVADLAAQTQTTSNANTGNVSSDKRQTKRTRTS